MTTLTEIANRCGTDKGTEHFNQHGYTLIYEQYLEPWRHKDLKMLEIGVLRADFARAYEGASLKMWHTYFPHARIYGYDLYDSSHLQNDRVTTFRGDQANRHHWQQFLDTCGSKFDVIIDDAIHASKFQQISLGILFPHLTPGGLYFIEDLDWQPGFENPSDLKTLELIRVFRDTGKISSQFMDQKEMAYLERWIDGCEIHDDKLCVLRKKIDPRQT
ncbi:MAG: hypothetical protein AAF657_27420 [Acidobacteriota bacterium]